MTTETQTPAAEAAVTTTQTIPATLVYRLSEVGRRAAALARADARRYQIVPCEVPMALAPHVYVGADGRAWISLVRDTGVEAQGVPREAAMHAIHTAFESTCFSSALSRDVAHAQPLAAYPDLDQPIADPSAWLAACADDLPRRHTAAVEAIAEHRRQREAAAAAAEVIAAQARRAAIAELLALDDEALLRDSTYISDRKYREPQLNHRYREVLARPGNSAGSGYPAHPVHPDAAVLMARVDALINAYNNSVRADAAAKVAADAAKAEERRAFLAEWIIAHGTDDQRERQESRLLPEKEILAAIEDAAFAPIDRREQSGLMYRPRYRAITRAEIKAAGYDDDAEWEDGDDEVECDTTDATEATAGQWAALKAVRAIVPEATVKLRRHCCWCVGDRYPETVVRYGIHVKVKVGPLSVVREYAAPDGD